MAQLLQQITRKWYTGFRILSHAIGVFSVMDYSMAKAFEDFDTSSVSVQRVLRMTFLLQVNCRRGWPE